MDEASAAAARPEDVPASSGLSPLQVFDRERASHPWGAAFRELTAEDDSLRWAVARNWQMDPRVTEERETDDLLASGHFSSVAGAEDWWEARYLYFYEEICRGSESAVVSAYLRPTNGANPVTARVAGFDRLVHVGCLNSIVRQVLQGERAVRAGMALQSLVGRGLPSKPLGTFDPNWLDSGIEGLARVLLDSGAIEEAAGVLVDALGESEPPWWACFAQEVQSVLDSGDAAAICSSLGLGHRRPGDWLLIWEYPVNEVSRLYRPTSIEAGGSPYHHPSPPTYPMGVTMPLVPDLAACREVIHPPLRGDRAVRWCTGRLLRLESSLPGRDGRTLKELRSRHRQELQREFASGDCKSWLDRHSEP